MRSKFKWIFTLLIALSMQFSFAQEKTVTGVVSDASGPLPGVNVLVKSTGKGVQTDIDGKYSVKAKTGDVLVFSFTGYEQKDVTVGASNTIKVTLAENVKKIDEVVVVGYGKTTKEAFTGTAAKINIKNIEAKTVSNVSQALRGEVAGVNVITGSGAPGSDATIRIRGFGSINGNRSPLYVVDGAPYSSDISAINPADIESMTVLKDAAATSIYGTRGANGVILITTKQGKAGKSVFSVDVRTSINSLKLPQYDVIDSPEQYIEMAWSSLKTKGALLGFFDPAAFASANLYSGTEGINYHYNIWNVDGSQLINPTTGKMANGVSRKYTPTKWSDAAFGTGVRSEANIQLSGGNEKGRYSTSFGYLDDKGFTFNSGYKRYTARVNVEQKPLDWLKVGGNVAYTGARYTNSSDTEGNADSSGNIFALTNTTPAIYDVYLRDEDGNLVADPIFGGNQYDYGTEYNGNPYNRRSWNATNGIGDAKYDLSRTDATTLLGNFNIDAELTKWLSFEMRYSGQYQQNEAISRANSFYGSGASNFGSLFKTNTKTTNQNFLQLLRFSKDFGDHNIEAFVAHESTEDRFTSFSAGATHAILPNSLDLSQYTTPFGRADSYTLGWTIDSYFSQLNYNYKDKYFLSASARRDGSSRFENNKWGTFGSVGLGWIASKESFMSGIKPLNYLKLKASYGLLGDQGTSLQYGWQIYTINQTSDGSYSFSPSNLLRNPDLTWETSKIAQVGFESSWLNNSLDVDVDYYSKKTVDLFFDQELAPFTGFPLLRINGGEMKNSGLEFDVTAHLIKAKEQGGFTMTLGVNGELPKNEITEMPIDPGTNLPEVLDNNQYSLGHSIYDWYMQEWAGVDAATGSGLWNMYYDDINANGVFDNADAPITNMTIYEYLNPDANVMKTTTSNYAQATRKYTGQSAMAKVRGAFRLNLGYKNLDFSAQMSYSLGGYVYDNAYAQLMDNGDLIGANNWHKDMENAWKEPGDVTNVPRLSSGFASDVNFNATSTRFLTKADYLSLNNVKLGYNFSGKVLDKLKFSKINIYITGDNLLMFSARKGLNPTTMISSSNSGIYMPMTTFSFGTKIEF